MKVTMKRNLYYRLAQMRRCANTPKGEKRIVATLTTMTIVLAADVVLLVAGVFIEKI